MMRVNALSLIFLAVVGTGFLGEMAFSEDSSWSCQAFCQYYPDPGPGPVFIPYPRPYDTRAIVASASTASAAYAGLTTACEKVQKQFGDPNAPQYAVVDRSGRPPLLTDVCIRD
jgi:hypothetical protein